MYIYYYSANHLNHLVGHLTIYRQQRVADHLVIGVSDNTTRECTLLIHKIAVQSIVMYQIL